MLWACNLAALSETNQPPTLIAPTESAQAAPPAAPGQQYTSPDFGFSLSYPAGFELQQEFPHAVTFLAPPGTPGHRERGFLSVEQALDQDAEWYANYVRKDNANLGIDVTASVQVLDGQQAYILGQVPGQDLSRQVFVVNNGILYHLTFVPDHPAAGEDYEQMQALYTAVIGSLRFLPERRIVPPITGIGNMIHHLEAALNGRSADDISRLLGDEFVLGYLSSTTSEGVTFAPHGRNEVGPLILNDQLSQAPAVTLQQQVDWATIVGALDNYSGFFPGEVVTPLLAQGWGPDGTDQAVIIIARRYDNSLYWRGAFVIQ